MNRLEEDLRALLVHRAGSIAADPERHATTLGRARARRRVTVGVAALAVVAIVGVAVAVSGPLSDAPPIDPVERGPSQTTTGTYGFTSTPGTGRVIATGTFKDTEWVLRGKRQRLDSGQDGVKVELLVERGDGRPDYEAETVVLPGDDILQMAHTAPDVLDDEAEVVFGATVPGIDTVAVDYRFAPLGPSIVPHRFTDYRLPGGLRADYYIAFVRPDVVTWVAARNDLGIDLDVETIHVGGSVRQIASGWAGEPQTEFERVSNWGMWWLEFRGWRRKACLVFHGDTQNKCFARSVIKDRGPLLTAVFEREDVLGVTAMLGDHVDIVRLRVDGDPPATLPPVQPSREELRRYPLRIVAVGLEPGTTGRLEAIGAGGQVLQSFAF